MSCEQSYAQIMATHPTVVLFCEECGDRVPGVPFTAYGTEPPAITYVKTTADRFDNLAALAGCPTTGAAQSLRIEHDHGELIVPEHTAVKPVMIVEAAASHEGLVAGLSITGTLALIVVARVLVRRRAHRPRL